MTFMSRQVQQLHHVNAAHCLGPCNLPYVLRLYIILCFTGSRGAEMPKECPVTGLLMSSLCRGRTLWLIGDSHTYDLFHSVACLMLDFWDYAFQGSFPTNGEEQAFEAMAQHVVHSKPPECLPLLEGTMVCHFRVNHGQVAPHQGSLFDSAEVICVSPYMHACGGAPKYAYGIAQTLLILSAFPLFPEACCMRTSSRQLAAKQARNLICHILL